MTKVVITPVGTSLFTNGQEHDLDIRDFFADIKDESECDWARFAAAIDPLREASGRFIETAGVIASAEFQSTKAILDGFSGEIKVHLLASDTIASRLAAEIVAETINPPQTLLGDEVTAEFNVPSDVIGGLQIQNRLEFLTSIPVLQNRLSSIRDGLEIDQTLAINITPGYAITVALLTRFANTNGLTLYYNFEDTNEAIIVPEFL